MVIKLGRKFQIDGDKFFTCGIMVYRYTNLQNIRNPQKGKVEVFPLDESQ
jgi:hypothetical protein